MKKKLLLISLVIIVALFTSCEKDKKDLAILLYNEDDLFIKSVANYIEEYDETGYNISIYDCKSSQVVQNEIGEELYNKGVDLLVINPVDRLSSYIFVEKFSQAGIPLIFFNRQPLEKDIKLFNDVYYIGANPTESAMLQAKMVAEAFGNNPDKLNKYDKNQDNIIQAVILKGEQGHQDTEERTVVVVEELSKQGFELDLLNVSTANWDQEEAYRIMSEIMGLVGDEIEVLISNNDAMAIGAINYLKDKGYFGEEKDGLVENIPFIIVGIDGIKQAKELTKKGYMYGTTLNDASNMSRAILELSEYILDGKDLSYELEDDKYIWIPYRESSVKE